ncbi:MAG TPA: acyltransferase [Acidimicrobiales bacterium]|nr:acyltransferase [Acidimicrobiales bacterium]
MHGPDDYAPQVEWLAADRRRNDLRFLPSGDEAGSAPEDRPFRPDVEGLRAIAILFVVLFHVGLPEFRSGYTGVDIFFVISGFVITGLLLRERASDGKISFLTFYARRAKRILPAAILVIVVTLVATYLLVGRREARLVADDSRWTALFLGNFHFANLFPNVFVKRPASPLTNYWSLAVEEQFYLVYPAFFVLLMSIARRRSFQARLAIGLVAAIVLSFAVSAISTKAGQFAAYYSPLTRVWELAIGALIAVGAPQLKKLPSVIAASITWLGMLSIAISAVAISTTTPYPGISAALPVVGTALVIAGGTAASRRGAEVVLRLPPFRWIGRLSYSWYLWHLPILVIAAEYAHTTFASSVAMKLTLVAFALLLAAATYLFIENPIRHSVFLTRNPQAIMAGSVLLVGTCVAFTFAF